MSLKPLGERVILKLVEAEEKTEGGIVLPDTAKEKPQRGEVVAVGSGKLIENGNKVPLEVNTGDKVFFSRYAGTEVKDGEETFLIVNERDILAIVD
ncbi:MAG TPA: co-chaperone GroES [Syntrophaceticus sp.]|jgi:chaperonin GroES|uniref:Co-chaperonin GroES n=1 Tax=Syntrophaceticus schinkii TaxID=499207 RepID=A0A0B7MCI8_9FIRM|nr:co-chaperone GroES [Syntrophaceticus schinkii]HHY29180.1 co-chaperone GroES [Syntrophaceticus sp.]MDD2358828.1 co-chaperone GroES [Syntrophaceticus schinkii]MDD4260822.1 co-chaperone GroES [Syntrophaceticus schinkii]MDD4674139.1 co-chaperone GroES [Syntrophaceticus schinkii]CEO88229.1 chaperonin small subunit [Syntrophaceticus schinkii]